VTSTTNVAIALSSVLFALSALHVWWAIRGGVGDSVAIPKVAGKPVFVPSRVSSATVALLLFCAACVGLLRGGLMASPLPARLVDWLAIAAGCVFLLRAIGEFRLVGFFKRVRGTDFARWDYLCFSPLCVLIAAAYLYLALN
jgi:hypothetical protein